MQKRNCRISHDDGWVCFDYSEINFINHFKVNSEVKMDHYSLEMLGKLHHQELVREGVQGQAVSRLRPAISLAKRLKRGGFVIAAVVLSYFWLFV